MTAFLNFPLTRHCLAALLVCACVAGCASQGGGARDTFKPYVPEVVQGNFVSKEQRQALSVGMVRAQVADILGTPLITSLFHADRWDYAFTIRRQGVAPQSFQLTVFFKGDVLHATEGGDLPSEAEFAQRLVVPRKTASIPKLQASEDDLKKFAVPAAPDDFRRTTPLPSSYPPLEPTPR